MSLMGLVELVADSVTITDDLIVCDEIQVDTINEKTASAGVTVDSVLLKDNSVTANLITANSRILTNEIQARTGTTILMSDTGNGITNTFNIRGDDPLGGPQLLLSNNNNSHTATLQQNVTAQSASLISASGAVNTRLDMSTTNFNFQISGSTRTQVDSTGLRTNDITEITPGHGVDIEAVNIKDGDITISTGNFLNVDEIYGYTPKNGGVYLTDGVALANIPDINGTVTIADTTNSQLNITAGNATSSASIQFAIGDAIGGISKTDSLQIAQQGSTNTAFMRYVATAEESRINFTKDDLSFQIDTVEKAKVNSTGLLADVIYADVIKEKTASGQQILITDNSFDTANLPTPLTSPRTLTIANNGNDGGLQLWVKNLSAGNNEISFGYYDYSASGGTFSERRSGITYSPPNGLFGEFLTLFSNGGTLNLSMFPSQTRHQFTGDLSLATVSNNNALTEVLVRDTGDLNKIKYRSASSLLASLSAGEMHMQANATVTNITTTSAFVKIAGTTTAGNLQNFTHTSGRLTYTGTVTALFHVEACLSFSSATNNKTFEFRIAKNGTTQTKTSIQRRASTSDVGALSLQGLISLATNDYIEVFVTNITDDADLTVTYMNVVILE